MIDLNGIKRINFLEEFEKERRAYTKTKTKQMIFRGICFLGFFGSGFVFGFLISKYI